MSDPQLDDAGRPEPPAAGSETEMLVAFLDFHRATFAWKCAGLDSDSLSRTTSESAMTLGGMMKHLAIVEDGWFTESLLGQPLPAPWSDVDWDADRDWEWHTAGDDSPAELLSIWQSSIDRSRAAVARALAVDGMDTPARRPFRNGDTPSLRWIFLHMIEEYARHNGHADLLREAIDGKTGE